MTADDALEMHLRRHITRSGGNQENEHTLVEARGGKEGRTGNTQGARSS